MELVVLDKNISGYALLFDITEGWWFARWVLKITFQKITLLINKPVKFWDDTKKQTFDLILPTVEDLYTNEDLSFVISLLDQDLSQIQKMISMKIESHYEFIHLVCSLAVKSQEFNELSIKILDGLKLILPGINFKLVLR